MAIKRDAADIAFSKVVRARDGECLVYGKRESLECAHIYGRRAIVTRWDLMNAVTLTHYRPSVLYRKPRSVSPVAVRGAWRGTYGYLARKA